MDARHDRRCALLLFRWGAMFPLSRAHVCARAQVLRRSHTRKLGAHINVPSSNVFAHISYISFQIQMSLGKMSHKRNFISDFKKLEGTLVGIWFNGSLRIRGIGVRYQSSPIGLTKPSIP